MTPNPRSSEDLHNVSSEQRPPVQPTTSFPFPNCFHWIDNVTNIRVRRPPHGELFDNSRAISLGPEEHVSLQCTFSDDYDRVEEVPSDDKDDESKPSSSSSWRTGSTAAVPFYALRDPVTFPEVLKACTPLDVSTYQSSPPSTTSSASSDLVRSQRSSDRFNRDTPHPRSASPRPSDSPGYDSDESRSTSNAEFKEKSSHQDAELFALNIFGWDPDPTFPLIPLVDLWFELEEHLTADTIPSPVNWYEEARTIKS